MTIIQALATDTTVAPLEKARQLRDEFASTAVQRDRIGGTPKHERDLIRSSGLLALSIPKSYGGLGGDWHDVMQVVRLFAQVDSSIAHVYGFHHLMLATVRLFAEPQQWQRWYELTARRSWFWGNALNPLDTRTTARQFSDYREFSGKKSFCSGALDSEMLIASAVDEDTGKLLLAAIPTTRSGITLYHDWDNIGQRQTDSGSAIFERVRIEENEMLLNPGPLSTPFACLRPLIAQLVFVQMFLGLAEGAFFEAKNYTLNESRAWHRSPANAASEDPYILRHYGEFWVGLESVRLLAAAATEKLQAAWSKAESLTLDERGEVAIAVATAKVASTQVGLDISNRLFEVAGARATHAALRFDRYWRNLRTQTLHDPVDYKIAELGEWALNDRLPTPSFYS